MELLFVISLYNEFLNYICIMKINFIMAILNVCNVYSYIGTYYIYVVVVVYIKYY